MNQPPTALIDSCIFYSAIYRDIVMYTAIDKLFQCKWTKKIESEWREKLLANQPTISREKILKTQNLMRTAILDWEVSNYQSINCSLPDPNDNHVLKAAIKCEANFLVTENLKDFPQNQLSPFKGKIISLDHFLLLLCEKYGKEKINKILSNIPQKFKKKPMNYKEWVKSLSKHNLVKLYEFLSTD